MNQEPLPEKTFRGITVGRRVLRLFFGLVLLAFILLGSFFTVIQLPVVQQWGIARLTNAISSRTGSVAGIDRFYLTWRGELRLEGVYLEDLEGDTLLNAATIGTRIIRDFRGLFIGRLEITDLFLGHTTFRLRHYPDGSTNVDRFFDILFPPREEPSGGNFDLRLRQLRLEAFRFLEEDPESGRLLEVFSGRAFAEVRCIRFSPLDFELGKVVANGPRVRISQAPDHPEATEPPPPEDRPIRKPLGFFVEDVRISNGHFSLDNGTEAGLHAGQGGIDFANLELRDIQLHLKGFRFNENHHYQGELVSLQCRERGGFQLSDLRVAWADVAREGASLDGLRIETPHSSIGDTLHFSYSDYPDFLDFNNRVFMDARFRQSRVQVSDLFYFAPALQEVSVFGEHPDMTIQLEGMIGSRVNNLRGRDLELLIGDELRFTGDFGSRNLTVPGEASLNLKIDELSTSVSSLSRLIPGFRLPASFRKLGRLRFSGRFDGFLVDFVSYGDLRTDLGMARLDMRMNLKKGVEKAEYSGGLNIRQFDLGAWTGNPDLGTLTFHSTVRNGRGLTLDNLQAELEATVDSLSYRGYVYRNLKIDGALSRDRFDGQFDIRDPAIDVIFEGFVQYGDSLPLFDFRAILNRVDLQRMRLSKSPLTLAAMLDFNLRGRNLNALTGAARVMRLEMDRGEGQRARADSMVLRLDQLQPDQRSLRLISDIADLHLEGDFQLEELLDVFSSRLAVHAPELIARRNIKVADADSLKSRWLRFELNDRRLDGFIAAFTDKAPTLDGASAKGSLDLVGGKSQLELISPSLAWKDNHLQNLRIVLQAEGTDLDLDLDLDGLLAAEQQVDLLSLHLLRTEKDYNFLFQVQDSYPFGTRMAGRFSMDEEGYHFALDNDSLVLLNQVWQIAEHNAITVDSQLLAIHRCVLRSGNNIVEFKDQRGKGVIMHLEDLDLQRLNDFLEYEPIAFSGFVNVDVLVRDVFAFRDFAMMIRSDDFLMNGDHFGRLHMTASMSTLKSPLEVDLELDHLGENLSLNGKWFHEEMKDQGGRLDADFTTSRFPIAIAEYFLDGAIVNTRGMFDARLQLSGPVKKPEINGTIDIEGFETSIDYLGVRYAADNARILVSPRMFDATGLVLRDPLNNTARVTGGLTHDHFRNWGLQCAIRSDQFMALNTRKQDNPFYYGTGIGRLDVQFSGTLQATDIYVRAVTSRGSNLSIPVSQGGSQVQLQFVEFYSSRDSIVDDSRRSRQQTGLQLEMDVEMTEEALVQIIFDERTGDILRGYGRGNIRLEIPRTGSLKMFGNYGIERGDYLFTFQNLVNKSFEVERGGTIQWSGDPFDAQINMRTIYTIPSTSVYNLIAEYLVTGSPGLEQAARSPTEVQLFMNLTGKLLQPDIAFDLGFPRLFGEVRSLVESKMQNLRRDPNDLNWQVFGLIVANNFLPPGLASQGTEYIATINTVSEMISNQFSRYITALMSELVSDVGIISDVGFDFNYNLYQSQAITQIEQAFTDSKIQVTQRINFYDDRLSLAIEGSVINTRGIEASSGVLIGGDFKVEYALTEDRRLKLRVYQRSEPTILGNNRYKVGAGLTFRKEFD
jgi:hypothetical protein